MKLIYLPLLVLTVGCAPQLQPQYSGPASLQVVPPSYYSARPAAIPVRKRQQQPEPRAQPQPRQQRYYYYPEPGKPVLDEQSIEPEAQQIEDKLDEAAEKMHKLRQRLNRRRPAFGSVGEPPPEDQ